MEGNLIGLVILTCYHMEEGKIPSSMAGSQDALLPTPIGHLVIQTIATVTMIIHTFMEDLAYGTMQLLILIQIAAVSISHPRVLHPPDLQLLHHQALQLLHP